MIQSIDRNNSVMTISYDGLSRPLTKSITNAVTPELNMNYTYTYYRTGKVATINQAGITSYTYDELGRLVKETEGESEKQYTYDIAGNRKSFILKDNISTTPVTVENTTYEYDKQNRLEKVYENSELLVTYAYDINGNRDTLTYSNGVVTEYEYNLANRLAKLTNKTGIDTLSQFEYDYYTDGNQAQKKDSYGETNYTYDGLSRLVTTPFLPVGATEPKVYNYAYDDKNNRKALDVNPESEMQNILSLMGTA